MNSVIKQRLVLWGLISILVLNLSALAGYFIFRPNEPSPDECISNPGDGRGFMSELNLSGEQQETVARINKKYRQEAEPLALRLREQRNHMLTELEKDSPDTLILEELAGSMSVLQEQIQKINIRQYLDLKKVCTPEQALRLSALYRNLYGCPMQGNKTMHRHQNRHGKGVRQGGYCY